MAKREAGLAVALAAMLAAPACARADMLWRWSYVNADSKVSASGTLKTKDVSAGAYQIVAVAGSWNGASITGLEPVKSCCSPPGWNNNLLIGGDPKLDKGGFAFSAQGGVKVNLFFKDGRYAYEIERGSEAFGGAFSATPGGAQ